jgi:hypothetical protein
MHTETQAGLETGKAFLKDCVEFSHLLLKQKLEALKRGEEIDWKDARDIMREGRAAARQITQIAGLEVRDAAPKRSPQPHHQRPRSAPDARMTPEMMQLLMEGMMEWNARLANATDGVRPELPEELRKVITYFGLDPDREASLEQLLDIMERSER